MTEIDNKNGYELSRQFFNWCFDNPEKINPNHIAMYFFIIEHCNRLGWKDKFGLPTSMVKDAIGIRNFRTYSNTLYDLVDWGFIKMIEVSKNQYSSNIIAIVKNAKARTKALDQALQKHSQKQSQKQSKSIDSIDKQRTKNKEQVVVGVAENWRTNFDIYLDDLRRDYLEIKNDLVWISEKQKYHPNLNIPLTLEKSCVEFWATKKGWANKKKSKTEDPDWKATLSNALSQPQNKVYNGKNNNGASLPSETDFIDAIKQGYINAANGD